MALQVRGRSCFAQWRADSSRDGRVYGEITPGSEFKSSLLIPGGSLAPPQLTGANVRYAVYVALGDPCMGTLPPWAANISLLGRCPAKAAVKRVGAAGFGA
mmetsp:Transcript_1593/g.5206  ORF Transcript_1593/g.5206 Transcript_1593/m.5206 type:complete len:101 (-) Transcript_1593:763-1065(-)|eukprot:scaffold10003_cov117-Isochrysis_galbana.AAC.6